MLEYTTERKIKDFLIDLSNKEEMWKNIKHQSALINVYTQSDINEYSPQYQYNASVDIFNDYTGKFDRYLFEFKDFTCLIQKENPKTQKFESFKDYKFKWMSFMMKNSDEFYTKAVFEHCNNVIDKTDNSYKKQLFDLIDDYEQVEKLTKDSSIDFSVSTQERLAGEKEEKLKQIEELVAVRNNKVKPYFKLEAEAKEILKIKDDEYTI